jgi:hypothetical protein
LSETDEKLQKGIIELDKGNDKKAFSLFKDEAGKDKKNSLELMAKAVGTVEAARTALGPLVTGLAQWAGEKRITAVKNKALGLLAATKDLEDMAKKALETQVKMG